MNQLLLPVLGYAVISNTKTDNIGLTLTRGQQVIGVTHGTVYPIVRVLPGGTYFTDTMDDEAERVWVVDLSNTIIELHSNEYRRLDPNIETDAAAIAAYKLLHE